MEKLFPGVNDLATLFPEVAKEADGWDPSTVGASSGKKLPWKCKKGHTWEAVVGSRTPPQSSNCPFCGNKRAWPGYNDLATLCPEVAKEADGWDPTRVTLSSKAKVWWKCAENHHWEARVQERTRSSKGTGCPVCAGKKVVAGVNDLASKYPELAKEAEGWDPTTVTTKSSGSKRDWRCGLGHKWQARVADRTPPKSQGCPYCAGRRALSGFNDLATLFPEVAREVDGWDPSTVTTGSSGEKKKWKCQHGHTWEELVAQRTPPNDFGCPYCSGRRAWPGFNDLKTLHPELAKEANGWDPTKVRPGSNDKKKWLCQKGHVFEQVVANRTLQQQGCPYCSGRKVLPGFNDLATTHPELAKEASGWDPKSLSAGSHSKKAWKCKLGHEYRSTVKNRALLGSDCPFCSGAEVLKGFNDLATLFPAVAAEADGWDPSTVTSGASQTKRWLCQKCGKSWKATVTNRTGNSSGCPDCAESGFKTSLPAWFYLLERPGEQQLGVTNNKEVRLATHAKNGWVEVEVVGPSEGELVLETEKKLKHWLRNSVGLVQGTHENWHTTKLEVRTLAELKVKSGVETDLF